MRFLLLNGQDDSFVTEFLTEVLKPLGSMVVAKAQANSPLSDVEEPDGLIIIDATVVEMAERLVTQLLMENPERRIVVITASPTWQRARAVLEAGAMDYLPKTLSVNEMRETFQRALRNSFSG